MKVYKQCLIRKSIKLLTLASLAVLCSCASQLPSTTTSTSPTKSWRADGVFAYKDQQTGFNAGYVWQNVNGHYNIDVIGPLGAWRAHLEGNANHATLTTSDGKIHKEGQPEELMQDNLGWSIPVQDLMHWLWAEPNPQQPGLVSKNASGEVIRIQQNGWTIDYSNYSEYQNHDVANRISLTQNHKKITVIIQHRA